MTRPLNDRSDMNDNADNVQELAEADDTPADARCEIEPQADVEDATITSRDVQMARELHRLAALINTTWSAYAADDAIGKLTPSKDEQLRKDVGLFIWWTARRVAKAGRVSFTDKSEGRRREAKGTFGGHSPTELSNEIYERALGKHSITQLFDKADVNLNGYILTMVSRIKIDMFREHVRRADRELSADARSGVDEDGAADTEWFVPGEPGEFRAGVDDAAVALDLLNHLVEFLNQRLVDPNMRELALYLIMKRDIDDAAPNGDALDGDEVAYFMEKFGVSRASVYRYKSRAEDYIIQFRTQYDC